jgi:hypothetical protein
VSSRALICKSTEQSIDYKNNYRLVLKKEFLKDKAYGNGRKISDHSKSKFFNPVMNDSNKCPFDSPVRTRKPSYFDLDLFKANTPNRSLTESDSEC